MNRSSLNRKARQKIAQYCQDNGISRCELKLAGCMGEAHAPAHRHKRRWYYDKPPELLWDRSEWRASCQACHSQQEFSQEITDQIWTKKDTD
jgi:hypothetical protein